MEMYNELSEDVMLKENTIDWNQIHLDKLLASGNFGYVYKGIKFKSKGPFFYIKLTKFIWLKLVPESIARLMCTLRIYLKGSL